MDEGLTIPLRRRDGSIRAWAVVDTEDHASLAAKTWFLGSFGYAVRKPGTLLMHREILGLRVGDGSQPVDHINRDRLDNRKANLRLVTPQQQRQNLSAYRNGKSRFRGVYWVKGKGLWRAEAQLAGVRYRFGQFEDEVKAAKVADAWRLEHMPFAEPDPQLEKFLARG